MAAGGKSRLLKAPCYVVVGLFIGLGLSFVYFGAWSPRPLAPYSGDTVNQALPPPCQSRVLVDSYQESLTEEKVAGNDAPEVPEDGELSSREEEPIRHRFPAIEVRFWENEKTPYKLPVASENAALGQEEVKVEEMRHLLGSEVKTGYRVFKDIRIWGLGSYGGHLDRLEPDVVFNVAHVLWCERKTYEFQHYLSVRSVVKHIAPQRVVIHYLHYPRHDADYYNMWFEDMKTEFAFLELVDLSTSGPVCNSTLDKEKYIVGILEKEGGIYVHPNTIFTSFPIRYRKADVTYALSGDDVEGFLVLKQGALSGKPEELKSAPPSGGKTREETSCVPADKFREGGINICAIRKGPYFPRDSWDKSDDFSKSVNRIMYGEDTQPKAHASYRELIPNIGHVLWLGGREMDFLFYLNCLSQIHILQVDRLYVHGDMPPSGQYWETIKKHPKVTFVHRAWPNLVFRNKIGVWNHMSDVFRSEIMIKYGGFYTDTDAVWINPIPDYLRLYDAVASYDWPLMYSTYPDYLQLGVTMGRRNAKFWHLFQRTMQDFKDDMFGYNGLLKPYKLFERHPDLVHVYDKLQVMCWELRCHPTWYDDFRHADSSHLKYPDFNWTLAHSFHWTSPTPDVLLNETSLRQGAGVFADIGRHILRKAGLLDQS